MKLTSLRDLYVDQLRDLYSAETQLVKVLPKMAKAASSEELRNTFQEDIKQTKTHLNRLDQIFERLDINPKGRKCKGMEGLIDEGKGAIKENKESDVLDADLIAAAQRMEHYEIAGYGCVRTYATLLEENQAAEVLQTTLDEEKETDERLTELSKGINVEANRVKQEPAYRR
jgi:ferritin-like metal-binding protein YciE